MNYRAIRFTADNKAALEQFLLLPKKLYRREELVQDEQTERQLIMGEHILSRYFKVYPKLVLDEQNKAAARCVVTVYPDKECAYFGYFECIDDMAAAEALIERADRLAKKLGKNSLVGPVDCSFWIRYRLKADHFGKPYTCEPYNKEYYLRLLEGCGFKVCGEYISNKFPSVPQGERNEKFAGLLEDFEQRGIHLENSTPETFDKCLKEVYGMMIELYSGFQTFSKITEDEFCELFFPLRYVVDHSMVRMAYDGDKPVGFFVSVPDFGNAFCGKLNVSKLAKIVGIKRHPKCYIMMYMGANSDYHGLGKAMSESVRETLSQNGAESVSALIREGKVNSGYYAHLMECRYRYVLLERG